MDTIELKQIIKDPVSPADFQTIQDEARDCLEFGTIQDKMDFADYISEILSANGSALDKANAEMLDQYETLWALLAFGAFVAYHSADQDNLIRTRLLFAVQRGFETDDIIRQYYYFFNSDDFISYNLKLFVKSIEQNTETLGDFPISIDGKRMLPQIKYWVLDYSKYPSLVARRGGVERLNYINHSGNIVQLTQVQRQNLLEILKFYDDLQNPSRPFLKNEKADVQEAISVPVDVPAAPLPKVPQPAPQAAVQQNFSQPFANIQIDIQGKLDDLRKRTQE